MTNTTEKTVLPDVQAYFAKRDRLAEAIKTATASYEEARKAVRAAEDAFHNGDHWEDFAELAKSADPLVAFIGRNCADYPDEAETILKALPATIEELEDIAIERHWCSRWEAFMRKAIEEGVVTPAPTTPELADFKKWLRLSYGRTPSLERRLRAAIAAEVAAGVAAAQAEQQAEK